VQPSGPAPQRPAPSTEAKLRFLQSVEAHPGLEQPPALIETHMSWVLLAGERVLKLKKPVRYPFLDFSTLRARELDCREEVRLNSRLAPGVYLGVLALQAGYGGFALVPDGCVADPARTVDWLVLMRRLPQQRNLLDAIGQGRVEARDIDALVGVLGAFYRRVPRVALTASEYLARFQHEAAVNRDVLLRPQLDPGGAAAALARFDAALLERAALLGARASGGQVVDGHGDLRPEHVYLVEPPVVIDCLEFNAPLRQVDPFDEIGFLALECELAGAPWIGAQLLAGCAVALGEQPAASLMQLYRAHRALLRARLAMAHLLDPQPRTPQVWPARARLYIACARIALGDAGPGHQNA
jgi:uncharacterized protein